MHQLVALLIIAQTSKDSCCATGGLVVHVQSEEGGYPLTIRYPFVSLMCSNWKQTVFIKIYKLDVDVADFSASGGAGGGVATNNDQCWPQHLRPVETITARHSSHHLAQRSRTHGQWI